MWSKSFFSWLSQTHRRRASLIQHLFTWQPLCSTPPWGHICWGSTYEQRLALLDISSHFCGWEKKKNFLDPLFVCVAAPCVFKKKAADSKFITTVKSIPFVHQWRFSLYVIINKDMAWHYEAPPLTSILYTSQVSANNGEYVRGDFVSFFLLLLYF